MENTSKNVPATGAPENNAVGSGTTRTQTSQVIDCDVSVARVRASIRAYLNKQNSAVYADIVKCSDAAASGGGKGGAVYDSLSDASKQYLADAVKLTHKPGEDGKYPDVAKMTESKLTDMTRSLAYKVSQYANVATTTIVEHTIRTLTKNAMIATKTGPKAANSITNSDVIGKLMTDSQIYPLIRGLDATESHLAMVESEARDKLSAEWSTKLDRVQAKLDSLRESSKRKSIKLKSTKLKSRPEAGDEKGGDAAVADDDGKAAKEPTADTPGDAVKDENTPAGTADEGDCGDDDSDGADISYAFYIGKVITTAKAELGDEYKSMRVPRIFRDICSDIIHQLIKRMTNHFVTLTKLNNMKTVTDQIVVATLNLMLDGRDCAELVEMVNKNVSVFKEYKEQRSEQRVKRGADSTPAAAKPTDTAAAGPKSDKKGPAKTVRGGK